MSKAPDQSPPSHALEWDDGVIVCPKTGFTIAADLIENTKQRIRIRDLCAADEAHREFFADICRQSFLAFCCLFCWTYVVQEVTENGKRVSRRGPNSIPFVLWPVQAECAEEIIAGPEEGESIALPKSREMGATWLAIAIFAWWAIFHGRPLLMASRKQDLVEKRGDPDALFSKLDFLLEHLPDWMVGPIGSRGMHRSFESGGTIDGESTNSGLAVGGRKHCILLDESARMRQLMEIDGGTQHSTPCRLFISTIQPAHYFSDLCLSGRVKTISMGWWDHPQKGRDRRLEQHPEHPDRMRWTSSYYRAECGKATPLQVATELDLDHQGANALIFDLLALEKHIRTYARPPLYRGDVVLARKIPVGATPDLWPADAFEIVNNSATGNLLLWCDLMPDKGGRYRPDQAMQLAFGIDFGDGVGATPSVVSIANADTGDKIGRWLSRRMRPEMFTRHVWMLAHWFGGRRLPLLVPETNGGRGQVFIIDMMEWGYPNLYQHSDLTNRKTQRPNKPGWHSDAERKAAQIYKYAGSLVDESFKNPDREALDECRRYVHKEDGSIGPVNSHGMSERRLVQHGDMVIADMLADLGRIRTPAPSANKPTEPPMHSIAWHRKRREAATSKEWAV